MRIVLAATAALCAATSPAVAQRMPSERASLMQVLDGTTLTMEYHRPVARGRDSLFGGVVKWDQPWTPGANWATTFEVDREVRLNGQVVPKGKYSVWLIPRTEGDWTLFLHRTSRLFHTQKPKDESGDVVRFDVVPEPAEYVETLTWDVPAIAADVMTLRMHWGETMIPLRVSVQEGKPNVLEPSKQTKYAGTYSIQFASGDSAQGTVISSDANLRARFALPGFEPDVELLPADDDRFWLVRSRDGKYIDADPSLILVFDMVSGKAESFELRDGPRIIARGRRVP